jgi:uncharacterized iron-regulated membrane protein
VERERCSLRCGNLTDRIDAVWLRRLCFQVHLWIGIGLGLYVLLICLSGSVIVFRRELDRAFCPIESPGNTVACEPPFVTWIAHFHDYLLGGRTGLLINGVGAAMVLLMCVAGAIVWWPGRARGSSHWWRKMTIQRGVGWRRFTRDLHNMMGFWMFVLVFMWAATGVYFAFPDAFHALSDYFRVDNADTAASIFVEDSIAWLVRLHFGRSFGLFVKVLWSILGLVPCVLFVTGAVMWWNRVLRPALALNRAVVSGRATRGEAGS